MAKKPATSRTKERPKARPAKRVSAAPKPKPKAKAKAKAVKSAPRKVAPRRALHTDAPAVEAPELENTSGQGNDAVVPAEIMGWSWGAFLLNWIWAISHRVWIGLLTFVPGIGFLVALYLGSKGNELAWRSKRWDSVESFRATQRRWRNAAFIYFAAMMAFFALIVVLTVTLVLNDANPAAVTADQAGSRTITSDSGAVSITAPGSWNEDLELSDDADIQASDIGSESYLIVFAEPKSDFPGDATLTEYTKVTRDNVLASLEGGSQPRAAKRPEINGMPAIQSYLFGTISGQGVAYVHTAIETPTRFVQVVSWTLRSNWEQNKETLYGVAGSFVEVKGATPK